MGEARRRKLAGDYPEQCRVEDWRAPPGSIAITLDVVGSDPSSFVLDAGGLVDAMARVAPGAGSVSYASVVRGIAREFPRVRGVDDGRCRVLGLLALWTALHHPSCGAKMREAVSASLRKDGKAHISWNFGPGGLALALAGGFVDLDGLAANYAAAGGEGVAVIVQDPAPVAAPMH